MSDATAAKSELVTELKVSAHLMRLDAGLYCVFHSEGSPMPDPATGLPGARLTLPPGPASRGVDISGFGNDGWIAVGSASLIRVSEGPAHVLMTVYQAPGSKMQAPSMQVRRLIEGSAASVAAEATLPSGVAPSEGAQSTVTGGAEGAPAPEPEVAAHVQLRGDVLARIGEWIGDRGSQRWIEGFAVAPRGEVGLEGVEYQAVLGRGWLSPWAEGGQYCGSRGMALPILGLRARLRGAAAASHTLEMHATFTDGTAIGPIAGGAPCEAESLAPLEAFQLTIRPVGATAAAKPTAPAAPASGKPAPARKKLAAAAKPGPAKRAAPSLPVAPVKQDAVKPRGLPVAKPAAKSVAKPIAKLASRSGAKATGRGR